MSLQAQRRFCNLFIITCSIGVDVSKKSTASSIPSDIREDKRLVDCVLLPGHAENQQQYKDLGSKPAEKK